MSTSQQRSLTFPLLTFKLIYLITNLVLIKYIEDKGGKLGGISKREELLVYLLKAHGIQLPTGTIFNEAFVPTKTSTETEIILEREEMTCTEY